MTAAVYPGDGKTGLAAGNCRATMGVLECDLRVGHDGDHRDSGRRFAFRNPETCGATYDQLACGRLAGHDGDHSDPRAINGRWSQQEDPRDTGTCQETGSMGRLVCTREAGHPLTPVFRPEGHRTARGTSWLDVDGVAWIIPSPDDVALARESVFDAGACGARYGPTTCDVTAGHPGPHRDRPFGAVWPNTDDPKAAECGERDPLRGLVCNGRAGHYGEHRDDRVVNGWWVRYPKCGAVHPIGGITCEGLEGHVGLHRNEQADVEDWQPAGPHKAAGYDDPPRCPHVSYGYRCLEGAGHEGEHRTLSVSDLLDDPLDAPPAPAAGAYIVKAITTTGDDLVRVTYSNGDGDGFAREIDPETTAVPAYGSRWQLKEVTT